MLSLRYQQTIVKAKERIQREKEQAAAAAAAAAAAKLKGMR